MDGSVLGGEFATNFFALSSERVRNISDFDRLYSDFVSPNSCLLAVPGLFLLSPNHAWLVVPGVF